MDKELVDHLLEYTGAVEEVIHDLRGSQQHVVAYLGEDGQWHTKWFGQFPEMIAVTQAMIQDLTTMWKEQSDGAS